MDLEHELFRASMQAVTGMRQQHSPDRLKRYADQLEAMAMKHVATGHFVTPCPPHLLTKEANHG